MIPFKVSHQTLADGWEKLSVDTIVVNLSPDWRFFSSSFSEYYDVQITSDESKIEGVSWQTSLLSDAIVVPPGVVVVDARPAIEANIPQNMTNIELNVAYTDLPLNTAFTLDAYGEYEANKRVYLNLENDLQPLTDFEFPIIDAELAPVHQMGEIVYLEHTKLSFTVTSTTLSSDALSGTLSVQTYIENNSLLESNWFVIPSIAGNYGKIIYAPNAEIQIGPNQNKTLNFLFTPKSQRQLYVWFVFFDNPDNLFVRQDKTLYDVVMFALDL